VNYAKAEDGVKLWPSEGKAGDTNACMVTGQHRLKILEFDKFLPNYWYMYATRCTDDGRVNAMMETNTKMEAWFKENIGNGKFLNGTDEPS
jgi:hypothetical protein